MAYKAFCLYLCDSCITFTRQCVGTSNGTTGYEFTQEVEMMELSDMLLRKSAGGQSDRINRAFHIE